MSDARLRELERRWTETGSPDDEAAYLLERVRAGELTRERLELAATCGHPGSRAATGIVGGGATGSGAAFTRLVVETSGASAGFRALTVMTRLVLEERRSRGLRDDDAVGVLHLVERWLDCPCASCAFKATVAAMAAAEGAETLTVDTPARHAVQLAIGLAQRLGSEPWKWDVGHLWLAAAGAAPASDPLPQLRARLAAWALDPE